MKRLCLLAIAGCTLACGSDSPAEPAELFSGTYVWLSSMGGLTGQERTPTTEGVSILLEYDGRRARAYQDATLVGEATYTATALRTFGPLPTYSIQYDGVLNAFPFDALDEHTVVILSPATIRFDDPCCDRWMHTLVDVGTRDQGG